MTHLSVRNRTTLISVVSFGVAIAIASIGLIVVLRDALLDEIDRSIDSRAADIAAQVDSETEFISLGAGIDTDTLAVVFSLDGALFDSSDLSVDVDTLSDSFDETDTPFNVSLPRLRETTGADNLRAVVLVVELDPGDASSFIAQDDFIIYVATSLDGFDRTVSSVKLAAGVAAPTLVVLVGILTWVLAGRALAPVERIRVEVDEISATDLHRRVPGSASRDEIGRLAATMNAMLNRLESSHKSQRQFVADASHELRSPLAAMAARIDVALRHGDEAQWQATAVALRRDVDRMHRLVEDLLLLARTDGVGNTLTRSDLVDLDDVVLEAVRTIAVPVGINVDAGRVSGATVRGDVDQLGRLIANLVTNAIRHADELVTIELTDGHQFVTVVVSDDGPGIDPEDRGLIFDRFVRLDEARARDAGGSGLGLAISREIAVAHGGEITVTNGTLGGAEFTVRLPSAT